jgi:hypothetical protein
MRKFIVGIMVSVALLASSFLIPQVRSYAAQVLYYSDSTVTGSGWTEVDFGFFTSAMIIITATSTNGDDLYFSFDGQAISGRLVAGESINLGGKNNDRIWLKPKSGTQGYRLWAY